MTTLTSPILLNKQFRTLPYKFAIAFIESILQHAARTCPRFDVVGLSAMAAIAGLHSSTLVGIAASPRISSPADYLRLLIAINRPAAWRMFMVDEFDEPLRLPGHTDFGYKMLYEAWQNGLIAYDHLRAQVIADLPVAMSEAILRALDQPTIADIIQRIRVQYVVAIPDEVQEQNLRDLTRPMDPSLEIEATLLLFEFDFDSLTADQQATLPAHKKVEAFVAKLPGPYLDAVTKKIRSVHPTNATKHWNPEMRDLIKLEMLGVRETLRTTTPSPFAASATPDAPPHPDGVDPFAAAATHGDRRHPPPPVAPAATQPPRELAYCFIHGRGFHPSIKCTAMINNYGPYDPTNDHAEKYECFTGGKNLKGVISSSAIANPLNNRWRGGRGRGRGGRPQG